MKATKLTTHNSTLNINSRAALMAQYGFIEFDDEALCDNTVAHSNARKANPIPSYTSDIIITEDNSTVFVSSKTNKEINNISVYDMNCKLIIEHSKIMFDNTNFKTGIYILNVLYADNSSTTKYYFVK